MVEVVYIDQNRFLREMVEYSLKADGGSVFTIETGFNQRAIIEDLSPKLVVLDLKTCQAEIEELAQGLSVPLLAIGDEADQTVFSEFSHYFIGMEVKPLSPVNLRQRFLSYCEE